MFPKEPAPQMLPWLRVNAAAVEIADWRNTVRALNRARAFSGPLTVVEPVPKDASSKKTCLQVHHGGWTMIRAAAVEQAMQVVAQSLVLLEVPPQRRSM